jgi:pimeloyl-ACP methyl ester carboxylesterase
MAAIITATIDRIRSRQPAWLGARRRRPPRPFAVVMLRFAFQTLGRLFPRLAGRHAYRLWFRTHRRPESAAETRWLQSADRSTVRVDETEVVTYRWGTGPTILLVHGWNGRATQLGGLAQALAAAGYQAVAFDAPAHGHSPGRSTHIYEFTEAIEAVAAAFGPVYGVVAHSFGCAATAFALVRRLPVQRVVMVAPPASVEGMVDSFTRLLGVPPRAKAAMHDLFEAGFGADLWLRFATTANVAKVGVAGMVIHDGDDEVVAAGAGRAVAEAWDGAAFRRTVGLGHHRVLRSREVARQVRAFFDRRDPDPPSDERPRIKGDGSRAGGCGRSAPTPCRSS